MLSFLPFVAHAAGPIDSSLASEILAGTQYAARFASIAATATSLDPRILAARIIAGALGVIGLIFLLRIVYAGFLWFNAQGNPEPAKKAKEIIVQSSIGAVLLFSSLGVARFIQFQLVNVMEENVLDALTTCSGSAGACCQEFANFQNYTSTRGVGDRSSWSAWNGASSEQQKLLQDWKNCRQRSGGWGPTR